MRASRVRKTGNAPASEITSSVAVVPEDGAAYRVRLRFGMYVSAPMTEETARFIRIDTRRRSNLRLGEEASLRRVLKENGLKPADYDRMSQGQEFYRSATGEIVVPARQVLGLLCDAVEFLKQGRERERWIQYVTSLRIMPDPIPTGRTQRDGMFERPVYIRSSGRQGQVTGRFDYTKDPYLADLVLAFTICVPPTSLSGDEVKSLLEGGGYHIGMGGARKVGKGRFSLEWFEPVREGER